LFFSPTLHNLWDGKKPETDLTRLLQR